MGNEIDEPQQEIGERQLLQDVRTAAGWRVSPRHLEAAVQALHEVGEQPGVERIAEIASAFHGGRSQRQSRNANLWRLLGAQLAARGKPAGPEAQLNFVGRARAKCEAQASDGDLLQVATLLASAAKPLTPDVTADVADWIAREKRASFNQDVILEHLDDAVQAVMESRAERTSRGRSARRSGEF